MLEMKRRTFEVQGLGGPEWAGVLEVQQSARAALGTWLGLPTIPRAHPWGWSEVPLQAC